MPSSQPHPASLHLADGDLDSSPSISVLASSESQKSDDASPAKTSSTESVGAKSPMSPPRAWRSPCLQPISPSMPRLLRKPRTLANVDSPPTIPSASPRPVHPQGKPENVKSPSLEPTTASPVMSKAGPSGGPGKPNGGLSIREQVAAATFGSVIAETILYPLDTVKLLQQIHGRGPGELAAEILRTHGLKGFYRGIVSRLVQTVLSNGAFFFFQALFKNKFNQNTSSISHSLLLNMVAQQMNRLLTTPFEVVANVNQSDPTSTGFFGTFLKIWRTEGLQSFWKGLGVALLLSSNPAFMFTLVDRLTVMVVTLNGRRTAHSQDLISAREMFFVSGVAKMVATLLTYPLIRVKVLLQTAKGASIGLLAMLQKIIRNDGLKGLYAGVWTMSWKTVIFNALMMAIKQKVHSWLSRSSFGQKPVLEDSSASNPQDSANSAFRRQLECLDDSLPYVIKGKVVYIDGAWSYLHPSHQHMLAEAQNYGDYLIVGVHDEKTRLKYGHSGGLERYENRLARIRLVRGVDAILHDAPWVITTEMLNDLNISVVLSGYKGSTFDNSVDPYEKPKQLGIYTSLADPYSGFWRSVAHVMFSNVDTADGNEDLTVGHMPNNFQTMFRSNSTGDFTIRRCNSFYFYHDSKDTSTYPSPHSRRARHLALAQQRRDFNTHELDAMLRAKKAGVQFVLPGSPEQGALGTFFDEEEEFNNFKLPEPVEKLPDERSPQPRSSKSIGKVLRKLASVEEARNEDSSNASSPVYSWTAKPAKPKEQQLFISGPSISTRPDAVIVGAMSEEQNSESSQPSSSEAIRSTRPDAVIVGAMSEEQNSESSQLFGSEAMRSTRPDAVIVGAMSEEQKSESSQPYSSEAIRSTRPDAVIVGAMSEEQKSESSQLFGSEAMRLTRTDVALSGVSSEEQKSESSQPSISELSTHTRPDAAMAGARPVAAKAASSKPLRPEAVKPQARSALRPKSAKHGRAEMGNANAKIARPEAVKPRMFVARPEAVKPGMNVERPEAALEAPEPDAKLCPDDGDGDGKAGNQTATAMDNWYSKRWKSKRRKKTTLNEKK